MSIPKALTDWIGLVESIDMPPELSRSLILAIIWQESAGNPYAWNPEPRYRYFWDVWKQKPFRTVTPGEITSEGPPADFRCLAGDPDQEWWGQQASWGLMQIMGAAARERGFAGPYLPELTNPKINLTYGVLHLWIWGYQHGKNSTQAALLRWNGGGNAKYPEEVSEKLAEIERAA